MLSLERAKKGATVKFRCGGEAKLYADTNASPMYYDCLTDGFNTIGGSFNQSKPHTYLGLLKITYNDDPENPDPTIEVVKNDPET